MNKRKLSRMLVYLKQYKYIVLIIGGIFVVFSPFSDVGTRWGNSKKINNLKEQYAYYEKKIEESRQIIESMNSKENLETFAREKFYMKNENEDIFIIDED